MTDKNKARKPLIIVDGFGFIFRAYHVQPPLTSPKGDPVGAIYGFTSMLLKMIADFKIEHAVIVLDSSGKNFRHDIYNEYKANRPPAPDDLVAQLKLVEKAANALNFECILKDGYEADDLIATLARKANDEKRDAIIISSDKDLMQLISDHVKMFDPVKTKFIAQEDVVAKFGVGPEKVREVQALMGDSSDNIPGVRGVGPKTAAQLINQFGDIESVLCSLDQIKSKRQQELLRTHTEDARISWQLVGLDDKVALEFDINEFKWQAPPAENISKFLNEYGFKSLNKRVENLFNIQVQSHSVDNIDHHASQKKEIKIKKIDSIDFFNDFLLKAKRIGMVSVLLKRDKDSNDIEFIFGVEDHIYTISHNKHTSNDEISSDLFAFNEKKQRQNNNSTTSSNELIEKVHQLLNDKSLKKITFNVKETLKICPCSAVEDLQIMDYVLSAGKKSRKLGEIISEIIGVDCEDSLYGAYMTQCYQKLEQELFNSKALSIYRDIDLPISYILNDMEQAGIQIDISYLNQLSEEFGQKISKLEEKIYALAGQQFNIASPKQLGDILFNKMQLPFAKTTGKTKNFSTSADILEKLQDEGVEIASHLLDWRHLTKLKNTYTDTLPKQTDEHSRVHTTFLQTVTSTGRLSSINPNVQNIPTRSEDGGNIRAAFTAEAGNKLISADYSQIELRILSHVANIEALKTAMNENRDIHAQTASQIFGVDLEEVGAELRRKAKAINFGIIYGISAFGLAKQLNISRHEAAGYIEKYFQEYPGIQKYMSDTIEFAKEYGYVSNLLGRKCFVPNINDKNHSLRSFGERAAINAPMQSLASDIVKIAMINLNFELSKRKMQTKMILQIHDELIFEAPEEEVEEAKSLIKETMEAAIDLDVRTDVEVHFGDNWKQIH